MAAKRFSIASLFLLIALVAAFVVICRERVLNDELQKQLSQRNVEIGYIDASGFAPNEGALRTLQVEGSNYWKSRIVLPAEHNYSLEYVVGNIDDPTHFMSKPLKYSGQFSLVIHQAIDYLKPNNQPREVFVTSLVDELNNPQSRHGIPWHPDDTKTFRNSMGHYSNAGGPNRNELQTFQSDETVILFQATYLPTQKEGDVFWILLVPKPMADPSEKSQNKSNAPSAADDGGTR